MEHLSKLLEKLPEGAKDLRLNLPRTLEGETLSPREAWSIALTSAYFARSRELREAILADGASVLSPADIDDAQAAAALMGMNTIYYRFRHMVGKEAYQQRRANLRMARMATPAVSKAQFELCSLACAALAGCEACLQSHEASVLKEGLTEDHVHDAVRIAAVVQGIAVALEMGQ